MGIDADLLIAAERGDTRAALDLLDRGAVVDTPGEYGVTSLMLAIAGRHTETVDALLRRGADPNAEAHYGHTATTAGVLQARGWQFIQGRCRPTLVPDTRLLDLLTAAGGRIGLREAILLGDVEVAGRVCDGDPSPDVNDEARFGMHETYLMLASQVGPRAIVDLLLDRGADIEGTDDIGHTALMRAAESGRLDIVERLLDRGADIDRGWPCDTALTIAEAYGHLAVASLIASRGGKRGDTWNACGIERPDRRRHG